MSPYYGMYVVLGLVFKILETVIKVLKLNSVVKALEAQFGNFIIGL